MKCFRLLTPDFIALMDHCLSTLSYYFGGQQRVYVHTKDKEAFAKAKVCCRAVAQIQFVYIPFVD